MPDWADATALVVVDVQRGFDDIEYWGPRNNPSCEDNIAALLEAWRDQGWPVVYVRHDSRDPASPLRGGAPGNGLKDVLSGDPDVLVTKSVHSAFYGEPDLHAWLQEHGIASVAVCGIQTNLCCESTARMAGDLGYEMLFVPDATHTFDMKAADGTVFRARDLSRATSVLLGAEFGTVVYTSELVVQSGG
ncbi:MAG: cysteine hydrolase family protein [Acidimicrobiia bacterium]